MEKDVFFDSLYEIKFRLAYSRIEMMLYFEKHSIFQIIFDLMMMLDRNRPECIEQFIADNIFSVAKKYNQINTFFNISDNVDSSSMLEATRQNCHVHSKLNGLNSNIRNLNVEITRRSNLLKVNPPHPVVRNARRILILGPPGCGKHRIGRWLSQRLGACLVSATDLLAEHVRKMDCFGRALNVGSRQNEHTSELLSTIVQFRLLQLECSRSDWLLVDFPNTSLDVFHFFTLPVTPNIVLVINAHESTCRRRKLKRNIKPACWKNMVLQAEWHFYCFNQQSVREALEQQSHCTILEIDGNRSYRNIQKAILKKLMIT